MTGRLRSVNQGVALVLLLGSLGTMGCAVRGPLFDAGDGIREKQEALTLHTRPVPVHLAESLESARRGPLVLYVTGDGGWRGADPLVFRAIVRWGYPAAGMEAGDYLDHLSSTPAASGARVAHDYDRLIAHALHALQRPPATPVVLVGFSRGAGLAVLAASQPALRHRLAGLVALALTAEEDEVGLSPEDVAPTAKAPSSVNPYDVLPRLHALRVAVVQSTRDHYVSAGEARRLFGPDSAVRRLVAIESDGHTFGGAREELLLALHDLLSWMAEPVSGTP